MLKAHSVPIGFGWWVVLQDQGRRAMQLWLMRQCVSPLRFVASTALAVIVADPTSSVAQTRCEAKHQSCIAECYARYFTVDPKRGECIANCMAEEAKCRREQTTRHGQVVGPRRVLQRATRLPLPAHCHLDARLLPPYPDAPIANAPVLIRDHQMAPRTEMAVDHGAEWHCEVGGLWPERLG